jgi:hypothetical protein
MHEGMQHRKRHFPSSSRARLAKRTPIVLLFVAATSLSGCFNSGFTYKASWKIC